MGIPETNPSINVTEERVEDLAALESMIKTVLNGNNYLLIKYGQICGNFILGMADDQDLTDLAVEIQAALVADLDLEDSIPLNDILLTIHASMESFKESNRLRNTPAGNLQGVVVEKTSDIVGEAVH